MQNIAISDSLHSQLAAIDWSAPWWQPWRAVGQRVAAHVQAGAQVCEALNAEQPTIRFVPQSALPEGAAYEAFIYRSASVPTRENLHDFFNGLAWIVFPQTKRRLNQLQAAEISASGVRTTRGALRDALTLFDENAALWPVHAGASTELIDALRAKQWQRAFIELRTHWHSDAPVLFGHALLEKLTAPYKSITAHVFIAQEAINLEAFNHLDLMVVSQLSPASLVPKPFIPLPVLGVPGWWADNADPAFYDDAQVFRAPRDSLLQAR
jgi:Protein of unknown function (DUF3025)